MSKIVLPFHNDEYSLDECLFSDSGFKINPSISFYKDRYWCIHRTNNLNKGCQNYLTEFDVSFNLISSKPITTNCKNDAIEDLRLFLFNDALLVIYTFLPYEDNHWKFQYSVGIGLVEVETGILSMQQSLRNFSKRFHEKNWTPLIYSDSLYLVTEFAPITRVLQGTGEIGNMVFREIQVSPPKNIEWYYGEIRGGTPFIPDPKSKVWQYSFIHSSMRLPNGHSVTRFYVYSILRLNVISFDFEIYRMPLGYSKTSDISLEDSITWQKTSGGEFFRVVFPMGIANYDDGLVMSYGKNDYQSRLVYYSWDEIHRFFNES